MEYITSTLLKSHKPNIISSAIAKRGALRERRNVRTSGGSISLVGNGIDYNEFELWAENGQLNINNET